MRLGGLLQEHFGLSAQGLEEALLEQEERGGLLGEILRAQDVINDEQLGQALALQAECPWIEEIEAEAIPDHLLDRVPIAFARAQRVLPMQEQENGRVLVAITDPYNLSVMGDLRMMLKARVDLAVTTEEQLLTALNTAYDRATRLAEDAAEGLEETHGDDEAELDIQDILDSDDEAPIIRFVNSILSQAIRERASDIHLEPFERELSVRFRVDGVLRGVVNPPKAAQNSIISRIKVMAGLNIAEKRLPQDGRIRLKRAGRDIDIRVSTVPTNYGERVVLRLLDRSSVLKPLDSLGFDQGILGQVDRLIRRSHGIILVTGPTGSGKTTTLYGGLATINSPDLNILTIEDPVEYQLPGVGQVPVNTKIDLTFANGLRAFLRQDPDVIMVGEIRDLETAEIAIQASLTGHLVLSTIHTNDASSAVTRLVDMGVEPFLVASSLAGILAQRLVRTICPHCRYERPITEGELAELGLSAKEAGRMISEGKGCSQCQDTGYLGRTGIYELLMVSDEVRDLVLSNADASKIKAAARRHGMKTLREDGASKVLAGMTSVAEVCRVTTEEAVLDLD
ncbi:MAG: type II secretion system protein GspE [Myxococcales bacterium]|nr:type II secretion system protein GspE [Myxococcales bacterium]